MITVELSDPPGTSLVYLNADGFSVISEWRRFGGDRPRFAGPHCVSFDRKTTARIDTALMEAVARERFPNAKAGP